MPPSSLARPATPATDATSRAALIDNRPRASLSNELLVPDQGSCQWRGFHSADLGARPVCLKPGMAMAYNRTNDR
jgi:hypothetical protein